MPLLCRLYDTIDSGVQTFEPTLCVVLYILYLFGLCVFRLFEVLSSAKAGDDLKKTLLPHFSK